MVYAVEAAQEEEYVVYLPRLSAAIMSFSLSLLLICRIQFYKSKRRIHWSLLQYLGFADVLNAINFILAATLQIVITPQSIDQYRKHGAPAFAYVLFPLGFFSGFLQLSFNALIPWLLYEYLFSFYSRHNHTKMYLRVITKRSLLLAVAVATVCSTVLLAPLLPLETTMMVTTGYGTLSSLVFLLILLYGYRRLRLRVNQVLKNQEDQRSFLRSVLLRGFLYTVTYIVCWMPLNIIRLANVARVMNVPEDSRLWLDVLGGSAGIINSLAFFVSEKTFPGICKEPNIAAETPAYGNSPQAEQALINTSDIPVECGHGNYLYAESTPSNFNEFYGSQSNISDDKTDYGTL